MTTTRSTILAILLTLWIPRSTAVNLEVQLERIEQVGGEWFADISKMRVRKFNRTAFVLDGSYTLFHDIDEGFEKSVRVAYSSMGNNQFNEYPMKMARKKICQVMVEEYADFQHIWANYSNLPQLPKGTTRFCPFPKGTYWVKDLQPDAGWIPPVVPAGLWRMTLEFWGPDKELIGEYRAYFRLTKGLR
ncbi:uncharacterized protein LOC119767641 [Culex quinquefasciatus]|uniref:uncharacterized protein LOC119767641 n=1 Tax=Culex quinquefasciatus TaxID=7176 RepID=UPI0018E2F14F|nr:uncharacterized protein LOC119767641 [Culex quinquefasciatus]